MPIASKARQTVGGNLVSTAPVCALLATQPILFTFRPITTLIRPNPAVAYSRYVRVELRVVDRRSLSHLGLYTSGAHPRVAVSQLGLSVHPAPTPRCVPLTLLLAVDSAVSCSLFVRPCCDSRCHLHPPVPISKVCVVSPQNPKWAALASSLARSSTQSHTQRCIRPSQR